MKLPRGQPYEGHLPQTLPQHFVCAECGASLIWRIHPREDEVVCAENPKHEGFLSRQAYDKKVSEERSLEQQENRQTLSKISEIVPEVKQAAEKKRSKDKRTLFGDPQ